MISFNLYDHYKDSDIEWIGEIPRHWECVKGSRLGMYSKGSGIKKDEVVETGIPCIRYGQIYTTYNHVVSEVFTFITLDTSKTSVRISNGTLLITGSGELKKDIGKCILYDGKEEIYVGGDIIILKPSSSYYPHYLTYLINSESIRIQKELLSKGEIIVHIYQKNFYDMRFPLPPLSEQEQIVSYLDEKTSLIDDMVEKKKRKIELLKEYRTSLINTVVTKGLNPDVPMKDSGIEWIGEIPRHWGFNKVGNNTYVKGRIGWKGLRSEDFLDQGPYLVTGTDFNKDGSLNWENMYHVSQERYDEDPFIQLQEGDVLITKDGTIGKVVIIDRLNGDSCLNSGIFLTRCKDGQYLQRFFFWTLLSNVFKIFVDYNSGGSTIQHLYQNVFLNLKIPLPPLTEQEQIVSYLDEKTNEIDKTIELENKKIELLKEYRQSLISNVVTGKIKVVSE